jgi:hypothetical protein
LREGVAAKKLDKLWHMTVHRLVPAPLPIPEGLDLHAEPVGELPLVQSKLNPVPTELFSEGVQPVVLPPVVTLCILLIWR